MGPTKYIFLLGGHDLEMIEIKNILLGLDYKENIDVYDKNLSWGANLSEYKDQFNPENTFVGIELIRDLDPPKHYKDINHHNEKADLPASIEQVADLLKYELTPFQKLVAINDKDYIPGLLKAGVSKEKIEEIRLLDRQAQGVTKEEEKLAKISIRRNLKKKADLMIVKSETSRFSPVIDRLYPVEQCLIYTDDELTYYGRYSKTLNEKYSHLIFANIAYSGGGDSGFFGISYKKLSITDLNQLKNEIISVVTGKKKS